MNYKTILKGFVVATSLTLAGSISANADPKVKLRIGHVTTIDAIAGKGSTAFKRTAEKLSNGEIGVTIFPNGQLGGELEMVSQVRLGSLDIAMVGSGLRQTNQLLALQSYHLFGKTVPPLGKSYPDQLVVRYLGLWNLKVLKA